jgi:hypothetical protein
MRDARTGRANGMSARDARTGCAHMMRAQDVGTERAHGMRILAAGIPAACEQRGRVLPFLFATRRERLRRSAARVLCARGWGGAILRRTAHSNLGPLRGSAAHPLLHPSLLPRPRVLLPLAPVPVVNFLCALGPSQSSSCPLSSPNRGRLWCAGSRARWAPSTTTRASLTRWPVATPKPCAASSSAVQQGR